VALSARSKNRVESRSGLPCSIGEVYKALVDNPAELAELNSILYLEGNTQRQVYDYLTDDGGFTIGFQSVNRHRGKDCSCFKRPPFRFCRECKRDRPSCVCGAA
jgi:hypothetical protein